MLVFRHVPNHVPQRKRTNFPTPPIRACPPANSFPAPISVQPVPVTLFFPPLLSTRHEYIERFVCNLDLPL